MEQELERRKKAGKTLLLVGISVLSLTAMAGCSSAPKNQEIELDGEVSQQIEELSGDIDDLSGYVAD